MKWIFVSCILFFANQIAFGQACSKYIVHYVGQLKSKDKELISVGLPCVAFLEGLMNENDVDAFVHLNLVNNGFNYRTLSHLTSVKSTAPAIMLLYKKAYKDFVLKITFKEKDKFKEIDYHINWDNIDLQETSYNGSFKTFEVNIGEIVL